MILAKAAILRSERKAKATGQQSDRKLNRYSSPDEREFARTGGVFLPDKALSRLRVIAHAIIAQSATSFWAVERHRLFDLIY